MATTPPQARTAKTRELLLEAAREIFTRDGYEKAQLDDIAATAGRTKGSVYGHFASKEDLFLALLQARLQHHAQQVRDQIGTSEDQKKNLATLRDFYVGLASDRSWAILNLEFRLYALRHPESRRRIQAVYESVRTATAGARLKRIFGGDSKTRTKKIKLETLIAALDPILSALILESEADMVAWSIAPKAVGPLFARAFDGLFREG